MTPGQRRPHENQETIVGRVADEFTERLSRGERPDVEEYVHRHPDLADELRGILAALVAMRKPPVAVKPTTAPAETVDFHAAAAQVAPAFRPKPDGRSAPLVPRQPLEIQSLLHRRLRVFVLILLGAFAFFWIIRFTRIEMTWRIIWVSMVPGGAFIGLLLLLTGIIWSKRVFNLRGLRLFEGVSFGATAVFYLWESYHTLFVLPHAWLVQYAQRHPSEMSILARQPSVIWITLIICYGTFIPNTGRRCAVVTVLMGLAPLLLVTIAGLAHQVPTRLLLFFLVEIFMWMSVAVAMAIYGSHKISVLRREALHARQLGQYQLKRKLGSGGMGEVYLAEHVLLRRPCAVKLIRPERAGDPAVLKRFLREVEVTSTLVHPNTIQVFDYGETEEGTIYYAMEYLPGLSLEELVAKHGPLPPARVVFLLRQLCGALAEAHAVGLIHRDLKPGNVILGNRGGLPDVAKLLDFGLVHRPTGDGDETRLTHAGLIFGTPTYMSPEQAVGKGEVDARSDIYSLGALAYFLLTSQPPFVRGSVVQTLAAHISEPLVPLPPFREQVPVDLQAVVLRCLSKQPEERYSSARAVDAALGDCACAEKWTATTASTWWETQSATSARQP
jgi:serine/threonine-protein kinase